MPGDPKAVAQAVERLRRQVNAYSDWDSALVLPEDIRTVLEALERERRGLDRCSGDVETLTNELREARDDAQLAALGIVHSPYCEAAEERPCVRCQRDRYRLALGEIEAGCGNPTAIAFQALRPEDKSVVDLP